jgi:hypothetical protein
MLLGFCAGVEEAEAGAGETFARIGACDLEGFVAAARVTFVQYPSSSRFWFKTHGNSAAIRSNNNGK